MKKVIALFLLLGTMACAFAQQKSFEQGSLTKDDYLKKSKGQKTAAIVLVSAGGALIIIAAATTFNDVVYNIDLYGGSQNTHNNETLSNVLAITGIAAIVGSIPLFVSAHKNKKRALSMSFKNELAPAIQKSMVFSRCVPSISLQFRL